MWGKRTFLVTAIGLLLLVTPVTAKADVFADQETGVDSGTCGDTIATACKTVFQGVANAGAGEIVRVDDTVGNADSSIGLNLDEGQSLIAQEFVGGDENALPEPDTIIDAGETVIGLPAIRVPSTGGGGTIQGFVIRSPTRPVSLEATATLTGNRIDEDAGLDPCLINVTNVANTSAITNNVIVDPTPAPASPKFGVCAVTSGAPSITSNTFQDLAHGVQVSGGNTTITSNTFSGTQGSTSNASVEAISGTPTITGNLIRQPGDDFVVGIALQGATADVGATLRRNTILDHRVGIAVNETELPVSLNGDLIAKSDQVGLSSNDTDNDGDAAVTASNVTIADSVISEVALNGTQLTLISGLLAGTFGITTSGDATCAINFSRGPSIGPGCSDFQTTAPPGFVSPIANDYHLAAGSAMIDMGEPGPAPPGTLDLDGQARVTDGNGDGVARRDIGADETPMGVAAQTPVTPVATAPAATTGQRAAALKKCKKKRSKRARRNCRKRAQKLPL